MIYLHEKTNRDVAEYETTYNSGTDQEPVVMLPNGNYTTFTLSFPGGGSGKIQVTTSPLSVVEAGNAEWFDWSLGVISQSIQDFFYNPTAIRVVRVSGNVKISLRG